MKSCKECGSFAFNLHLDGIDQFDLCDVHYWQNQVYVQRMIEREECAKICEDLHGPMCDIAIECAGEIRNRK